jgi:hypothetical protein
MRESGVPGSAEGICLEQAHGFANGLLDRASTSRTPFNQIVGDCSKIAQRPRE